jgi:hypothetical protein
MKELFYLSMNAKGAQLSSREMLSHRLIRDMIRENHFSGYKESIKIGFLPDVF